MEGRVLVVGGAGYVGSHCARRLADDGFEVFILDDLSTGWEAAACGELRLGDFRDPAVLDEILGWGMDAVVHLASVANVPDAEADPLRAWEINVGGTIGLLAAMRRHGVSTIVASSSAAVYGVPRELPIREDAVLQPISAYGRTKLAMEQALAAAESGGIRWLALRYFNAAGASDDAWLGEAHAPETHLVPLALEAARTGSAFRLYGEDHETPDGTCIRDFVHVADLAEAHALAVRRLLEGGPSGAINLGTGTGASVHTVLDRVQHITGKDLWIEVVEKRVGDPPSLVADYALAAERLGWAPQRGLDEIVASAWRWARAPRYGDLAKSEGKA